MLFGSRIIQSIAGASPFLIHFFMVFSVTAYTIFGALIMQYIENTEINKVNEQNGYMGPPDSYKGRKGRETTTDDKRIVLTGSELNLLAPELHNCVEERIKELMQLTKCDNEDIEKFVITPIDDCYRYARIAINETTKINKKYIGGGEKKDSGEKAKQSEDEDPWSFPNAVVFSYTVITTIGYGHVAPVSFKGRLFCIFYGLVGIPLTLLTIADIGMFLSKIVKKIVYFTNLGYQRIKNGINEKIIFERERSCSSSTDKKSSPPPPDEMQAMNDNEEFSEEEESEEEEPEERSTAESIALGIIFVVYLISGAYVISLYEPMGLFKAFYFIFVSVTTIGLGDLVPRSYNYLFVTFIYITVGLALTTMAVEIAAEYLKKLHYFGRKIESVSHVEVWFGGKKMKLRNLINHLGDQLNVPVEDMKNFNIDNFVDSAIKVTEGEIKTLRKPTEVAMRNNNNEKPLSYRDLRKSGEPSIFYADDRSSLVNGGSDKPPLAEDTARTISSDPRALLF
uniref:Potassium channel domain-containing protein n=1 Tax=Panagrolaimus sp. PS1159 TaxID=55785 RepID=A0AC35FJI3_9BILA